MKCEIIIIRYGLPELEQECIDSVIAHTSDVEYSLTVHDNYEADEGLSKVWNELIRDSDAEYICLLNNDTRVENKWLSKMLECFEEDPKLGALGPMTNSSTGPQGNRKYRTAAKRLIKARYPLVGFCLVFPRKVWEEVGGFDEGYEIYGEDSDFIMEIKERGYIAMIRTDVFIFHHGKSSTPIAIARGKDILKLKKESKERFIKKWKSGPPTTAQKEEAQERNEELAKLAKERRRQRAEAIEAARIAKFPTSRSRRRFK
jgi:GT2 family glycosyltransferase